MDECQMKTIKGLKGAINELYTIEVEGFDEELNKALAEILVDQNYPHCAGIPETRDYIVDDLLAPIFQDLEVSEAEDMFEAQNERLVDELCEHEGDK